MIQNVNKNKTTTNKTKLLQTTTKMNSKQSVFAINYRLNAILQSTKHPTSSETFQKRYRIDQSQKNIVVDIKY